jgi:hypothetical protein
MEGEREVLLALLEQRWTELQHEAMLLGRRFFQDRPRALARRLRNCWKTWRATARLPRPAEPLPAQA